jgi:LysM repeat protein
VFSLAENAAGFYVRRMKRISFFLAVALLALPALVRAQDAATEERLNKLSAQIQDLVEMQSAQSKRIEALSKELQTMQQEQSSKPAANYASQDDLKELAAKLKEVDRKRQEDNDHILDVLKKLGKNINGSGKTTVTLPPPKPADAGSATAPATSDKGFEYEVKSGDTLSAIIAAYREQNIKITLKQVLNANPGLDEKKLKVGQKIFIPAPPQAN